MGERGPQPENQMTVILPRAPERPKPFSKMTHAAKAVWRRIVDDLPAGFYANHELDQLRAYCEAAALNAKAISEMAKRDGGVVVDVQFNSNTIPQKSHWFGIWKETSSTMGSLGTKLRISKNSKLANREAGKIQTGKPDSRRAGLKFGGRE